MATTSGSTARRADVGVRDPTTRRSPWWGRAGVVAVWASFLGVCVTTACRFWSTLQEVGPSTITLAGQSGPLTLLGAIGGAAWARHFGTRWAAWWALTAIAPIVLVAQYAWPTSLGLIRAEGPSPGVHLTVVAQNLWYHSAEPDRQADTLLDEDADVNVLTQFTPEALEEMQESDLGRRYPFSVLRPRSGRLGMAVLSRIPLQVRSVDQFRIMVDLAPAGAVPVHLIATHSPAVSSVGVVEWHEQLDELSRLATGAGAGANTVIAGDLNATSAHVAFRELVARADLTDAQDAGGGGFVGTWNLMSRLPPLLRLDHILVGHDVTVHGFRFATGIGSDHQGIVAEIVAPPA